MESVSKNASLFKLKSYLLLTKPGIIFGNAFPAAAGFFLASKGSFEIALFFKALLGLSFVIGSASVFNNFIDRDLDQKMERTKERVLAKGEVSPYTAMGLGVLLFLVGVWVLAFHTTGLAALTSLAGFFIYLFLYSLLKYHTFHATLIGSIAGATPPVVGYTAVSNQLDPAALILFLMVAFWQMPHFFAIAIYRLDDYARAEIPILPIQRGMKRTKQEILFYLLSFLAASFSLFLFGYVGWVYLLTLAVFGGVWLFFSLQGFFATNDQLWAKKMFLFSLLVIMTLSFAVALRL